MAEQTKLTQPEQVVFDAQALEQDREYQDLLDRLEAEERVRSFQERMKRSLWFARRERAARRATEREAAEKKGEPPPAG